VACAGLRDFGLSSPDEVLGAVGSLWAYLTTEWLIYRIPTSDQTKSRWPVAEWWRCVQRALVEDRPEGLERMYRGKRRGDLDRTMRALLGNLASFGALTDCYTTEEVLEQLPRFVWLHSDLAKESLTSRIWTRRHQMGLP